MSSPICLRPGIIIILVNTREDRTLKSRKVLNHINAFVRSAQHFFN